MLDKLYSSSTSLELFSPCSPLIFLAVCETCLFGWLVSVVLVICQASKATGQSTGYVGDRTWTWRRWGPVALFLSCGRPRPPLLITNALLSLLNAAICYLPFTTYYYLSSSFLFSPCVFLQVSHR